MDSTGKRRGCEGAAAGAVRVSGSELQSRRAACVPIACCCCYCCCCWYCLWLVLDEEGDGEEEQKEEEEEEEKDERGRGMRGREGAIQG